MKTRINQNACLFLVIATSLGVAAYATETKTVGGKLWNPQNASRAFSMALTRSAHDSSFRNRLTISPESAKQAVAEEGQIAIPDSVVIMFHEDKSNENYHVFDLPKFDESARTKHEYREHIECCYIPW